MKIAAFSPIAVGILVAVASARVCDQTYYFQSASQILLSGATVGSIKTGARVPVDKNMTGVEVINASTEYDVMTQFNGAGSCSSWVKTSITSMSRKKGSNTFSPTTSTSNFIRLHSIPYTFAVVDFEYWFGFASTINNNTASIFNAIGKLRTASQLHVWYGSAIMTRNVKEIGAGGVVTPKGTRTHFYENLASSPDSADLQNSLLKTWSTFTSNDTQDVSFKVQLIKVIYDSVPPAASIRENRKPRPDFQVSRAGNMVFLQPGDMRVAPSEALGLYNMMGHKIATLHPTGYLYQWNGRTAMGAQAPPGVYFAQSGSRILGKFFYNP